jgi:hypothetical protein
VQQVRVELHESTLSQLAKGVNAPRISALVPLTPQVIRNSAPIRAGRPRRALCEKARPGAAEVFNDAQKPRTITMHVPS